MSAWYETDSFGTLKFGGLPISAVSQLRLVCGGRNHLMVESFYGEGYHVLQLTVSGFGCTSFFPSRLCLLTCTAAGKCWDRPGAQYCHLPQ